MGWRNWLAVASWAGAVPAASCHPIMQSHKRVPLQEAYCNLRCYLAVHMLTPTAQPSSAALVIAAQSRLPCQLVLQAGQRAHAPLTHALGQHYPAVHGGGAGCE